MKVISIGEILWDVMPEGEYLGGAPYNLACHLARLGHEVELVTAVGADARGQAAFAAAATQGVGLRYAAVRGSLPTGVVRVSFGSHGQPVYEIERPAAYDLVALEAGELAAIAAWDPGWICYGTLFHRDLAARASTRALFEACPAARRFYDVNLRPGQQNAALVRELAQWAQVIKMSEEEAPAAAEFLEMPYSGPRLFLEELAARYNLDAACLTRGKAGCFIRARGEVAECPGLPVKQADPVGAGDAFAAAFLHGMDQGWSAGQMGQFANRVGALVASRSGATPAWNLADLDASN